MKTVNQLFKSFYFALVISAGMIFIPLQADDYPDRPIAVTVAYSPGGATDFQARIVTMMAAQEEYLTQPIVIVNKPGAGGQVGWNWFAEKADADGYQLAAYNVPHFIAQSIVFDTKYNIDNLEPIANWGADPAVLIVNKDSEFNTAEELVEYAKANPGKVTVSGAGQFTGHHIALLQLAKASGAEFQYIPTKGGVKAMQRVLGGDVTAGFNNLSDSFRSMDNLKILAIADVQRNEEFLPDVPTFQEMGIEVDNSSVNFRGIMAKAGTADDVITKLADGSGKMFADKKVAKKMTAGGSPMHIMSRDEVIAMWKERQDYLTDLLKDLVKE